MARQVDYPPEYSIILQRLPKDGTPLELPMADNYSAMAERLKFYNFLRWCRRNPNKSGHLFPMYNRVVITVKDNIIGFIYRSNSGNNQLRSGLATALNAVLGEGTVSAPLPMPAMHESATLEGQQHQHQHVGPWGTRIADPNDLRNMELPTFDNASPAPDSEPSGIPMPYVADIAEDVPAQAFADMIANDAGTNKAQEIRQADVIGKYFRTPTKDEK